MTSFKHDKTLFTAKSALNEAGVSDDLTNARNVAVVVTWSTGTSAGVVTVEGSDDSGFAGTWKGLGSCTQSANSKDIVTLSNVCHKFVRARISTLVVGGTVSARLLANG